MENNLSGYLPTYMQEIEEIKQIMNTEQPEIDTLTEAIQDILKNQFVMAANEGGIARYEAILRILPKAADNLEERKFRILLRLKERAFYTLPAVAEQIENICGAGEYTITLDNANYTLYVKIALTSKSNENEVENLLKRMSPCNLVIDVSLKYNQYKAFEVFTHAQMANATHGDLRNEVVTIE